MSGVCIFIGAERGQISWANPLTLIENDGERGVRDGVRRTKGTITRACLYALIERIRGMAEQRDAVFSEQAA